VKVEKAVRCCRVLALYVLYSSLVVHLYTVGLFEGSSPSVFKRGLFDSLRIAPPSRVRLDKRGPKSAQ